MAVAGILTAGAFCAATYASQPEDRSYTEDDVILLEEDEILEPVFAEGVAEDGFSQMQVRTLSTDSSDLLSMEVLPADVVKPSAGCVLLGLPGKYITDSANAVARINEIRLEACREGVINPATGNTRLTLDDYVPIKWSRDLEYIARIRAAEAALTMQHVRTNGEDCFGISSESGVSSYGEVLAWNWSESMTEGIEQWYEEKEDWVNRNANAVTGHYTSMIDPENTYVGLGTFCSDETPYYNSTAGEFSFYNGLDEHPISFRGECVQTLEVAKEYLSGEAQITGPTEGVAGEQSKHILTVRTSFPYNPYSSLMDGLLVMTNVSWKSSDESFAMVQDGTVTAMHCGVASITAEMPDAGYAASMKFTVNHIEEMIPAVPATCTETGLTEGTRCPVCGKVLVEPQTASALGHTWNEGVITVEPSCTESGIQSFTCINDSSHIKTETVPARGHKEVEIPAVPATTEREGYTAGVKCEICGEILKAPEKTPVLEKKNGLILDEDGVWRVYADNTFQEKYTGIYQYNGGEFFISDGVLAASASGLNLLNGTWYFLADGQVVNYTGVAEYDGAFFVVERGVFANDYSGTVKYDGAVFNVINGQLYGQVF